MTTAAGIAHPMAGARSAGGGCRCAGVDRWLGKAAKTQGNRCSLIQPMHGAGKVCLPTGCVRGNRTVGWALPHGRTRWPSAHHAYEHDSLERFVVPPHELKLRPAPSKASSTRIVACEAVQQSLPCRFRRPSAPRLGAALSAFGLDEPRRLRTR